MCNTLNNIGKKQTFKSILEIYDRIEIPVIQRDYAQGRSGKKESKVRQGILDHIFHALSKGASVELDFIYGVERHYTNSNGQQCKALIPIDGQQRLTTLWLIHWFLACKLNLLKAPHSDARRMLERFTYETRVSSKDFLNALCTHPIVASPNIKNDIVENTTWFDEAWKLDPSISGFLTMLDAIANHKVVKENDPKTLYKYLIKDSASVSFYFLPLEKFGLGEEIYTRMNARGKILTDFEVFKSNFFKIIDDSPLKEDITQKIEYDWVRNLWDYREKGTYTTDIPFMKWLRYITQMLIETSKSSQNNEEEKDTDYLALDVLESVYSDSKNLQFLVDSLDFIPKLKECDINFSLEWDENNKGLAKAIKWIATDGVKTDVMKQLCIFAAIKYLQEFPDGKGISDYIRVIRNLIANTNDRSMRDWPTMVKTMEELISQDIYALLANDTPQLAGFRTEQREIEIFKAKLIDKQPDAYDLICEMDANPLLKAREGNLIIELQESKATELFTLNLNQINPEMINLNKLRDIFQAYVRLSTFQESNDFDSVWGEFLQTDLYHYNYNVCWWYEGDNNYIDYANHPIVLKLVREVMENNGDVKATLEYRQKHLVKHLLAKSEGDLRFLNEPKDQLYILYLGTVVLYGKSYRDFFVCNRYNFGWVNTETGYTTPFLSLLESGQRQVFQAYPERFRNDTGIVDYRTPWILKANSRGKNFFQKLSDWANN